EHRRPPGLPRYRDRPDRRHAAGPGALLGEAARPGVRAGAAMTAPRYNAWRFGHPDLGSADEVGLRLGPAGGVEMVAGDASVRQAILLLLSTMPGERVMRPA